MESLRVMPPVPITVRIAATTDYIEGWLVPKGTTFFIPVSFSISTSSSIHLMVESQIRAVNTWKDVWGEDAEEYVFVYSSLLKTLQCFISHVPRFNPKRWLSLPKEFHPVFSFLSFIAGPHACIGKTMAIIEMKAVLACVLFRHTFIGLFCVN
jgi:hypothetical protein